MRTIILGLSVCLSACVASVPVAEMNRAPDENSVIPANEAVDTEKPLRGRDVPPSEIRLALPYVINLESAVEKIRPDQVPALPDLDSYLIYTTDLQLHGRIWHRLRLGFFASRSDAEQALKKVSVYYPQAWIAKSSESERTNAQQHSFIAGRLASSPSKSGIEPATAMPTPHTSLVQQVEMPTWIASMERVEDVSPHSIPKPELDKSSDASEQFRLDDIDTDSIAEKTQNRNAQQDDGETEISYGREEDESVFVRSTLRGSDLFTVGTAYTQRNEGADLSARTRENDEQGFWNMSLSSAPGGTGPGFEAEFAQSSFDPETSEDFGSSDNRLVKVGTHGAWQGYQLGLRYQSVGSEFEKTGEAADKRKKAAENPKTKLQKGRQGTEAWLSRQFGNLGVKTVATVYEDQGEEDGGGESRFKTEKLGASLNYTILSWPQLGVSVDYASGVRSLSDASAGAQSEEVDVESIASSLYYSDDSWSGTLYVENATGEGTTSIANLQTYWLGGSYFPISTFSLTPSVSYVKEDYPEFDVSTDSFAASMTISYKPSRLSRFNFTGYSEYSTEENRDWSMDSEYMYNSLGINWDAKKPKSLIKKWSLELFHDQYTDNLYSANNTGGVGFMMTLRSAASPIRRVTEEVR